MIRAKLNRPNQPDLVVLGIDAENVRRLVAGRPLHVLGETVNVSGIDITVVYGETLRDVAAEFERAGVPIPPGALDRLSDA